MVTSVLMTGASLTRSLAFSVDAFDMIGADTGRAIELVDVKSEEIMERVSIFEIKEIGLDMNLMQFTIDSPLTCGVRVNGSSCRCGWRCSCVFQFELWTMTQGKIVIKLQHCELDS